MTRVACLAMEAREAIIQKRSINFSPNGQHLTHAKRLPHLRLGGRRATPLDGCLICVASSHTSLRLDKRVKCGSAGTKLPTTSHRTQSKYGHPSPVTAAQAPSTMASVHRTSSGLLYTTQRVHLTEKPRKDWLLKCWKLELGCACVCVCVRASQLSSAAKRVNGFSQLLKRTLVNSGREWGCVQAARRAVFTICGWWSKQRDLQTPSLAPQQASHRNDDRCAQQPEQTDRNGAKYDEQ